MEKRFYYYKRNNGVAVFQDGTTINTLKKGRDFVNTLLKHRRGGETTWRLYLDVPEDYEQIKSIFFTPSYWENKTWQQEANS